jgi:hypothetical protein
VADRVNPFCSDASLPCVPGDFTEACLIEVEPSRRSGRGRWWLHGGHGYTDLLPLAGVFSAAVARRLCEGGGQYPVDARAALALAQSAIALAQSALADLEFVVDAAEPQPRQEPHAFGWCNRG